MSLIGFLFNRSRIFGIPIPLHQSFEEVNLRFYVRRGDKRGVVFIRELVPRYWVAGSPVSVTTKNTPPSPWPTAFTLIPLATPWERNMPGAPSKIAVPCA